VVEQRDQPRTSHLTYGHGAKPDRADVGCPGYHHRDAIRLVLARGVDPALRDNCGMTAQDIAAQTGSGHAAVLSSAH